MPQSTKIEIRNIRLETLLGDMETKGFLRIPRFQRDYVCQHRSRHRVQLIAPQFVKPYVKSNKNDANDAEAICEAVSPAAKPLLLRT